MSEGNRGGRNRRPPEERRRQILDAALFLFLAGGLDETSVGAIAKRAGMATGTVYLYFGSKEQILGALHTEYHDGLDACATEIAQQLGNRLAAGEVLDAATAITELLSGIGKYTRQRRDHCELMLRYVPRLRPDGAEPDDDRAFIDFLATVFREGTEQQVLDVHDADMAAYIVMAAIREPLVHYAVHGTDNDYERFLQEGSRLLARALRP